jgi:hypothetical protein
MAATPVEFAAPPGVYANSASLPLRQCHLDNATGRPAAFSVSYLPDFA